MADFQLNTVMMICRRMSKEFYVDLQYSNGESFLRDTHCDDLELIIYGYDKVLEWRYSPDRAGINRLFVTLDRDKVESSPYRVKK